LAITISIPKVNNSRKKYCLRSVQKYAQDTRKKKEKKRKKKKREKEETGSLNRRFYFSRIL